MEDFDVDFDNLEKTEDSILPDDAPNKDSPAWTKYVLDQLTNEEKYDGRPKMEGLRRLIPNLIGPIVDQSIKLHRVDDKAVVASVKVTVFDLDLGREVSYESVANANFEYTQEPFNMHLPALAEAKAEGRVYRKILKLQFTPTSEELMATPVRSNDLISSTQTSFIDTMCKKGRGFDIDVDKLFKKVIGKSYSTTLSKDDGLSVMKVLSDYQKDPSLIDKSLLGYVSTWQN